MTVHTEGLPLFLAAALTPDRSRPSATDIGLARLADTTERNQDMIAALVPLVLELAANAPDGVTVTNLRRYAVLQGVLTGDEKNLHFLGSVMRRAGLVNDGETRRSDLGVTHGIRQVVWRLP